MMQPCDQLVVGRPMTHGAWALAHSFCKGLGGRLGRSGVRCGWVCFQEWTTMTNSKRGGL